MYVVAGATILVLGLNWPIMAQGVGLIPPLWLTAVRLLGAGLVMGVAAALRGTLHRPVPGDYPIVASVAVLRLALVYSLVFLGLAHVPPGRSSILVYTSALWTAPLAAFLLRERLPLSRGLGVVSGVLGVVVLVQPWTVSWRSAGVGLGYGLLLLAAVFTALGAVHIRGHRWRATPLDLMPWQLTAAGLITTLVALAVEGRPTFELNGPVVAILLYQVLLASTFGVWGVLTIGRSLPAVSASLLLMAVPAVGLLSSALFADEQLTAPVLIGMALVFGGVATSILSGGVGRRAAPSSQDADQPAPV